MEDDAGLAETIAQGLRAHSIAVDLAFDGEVALAKVGVNEYDVVVLDRDIPLVHGDEVCRRIIDRQPAPRILMLTAAGAIEHRVQGLDIGADDYLSKPFAFEELVARVRALARRPSRNVPPILHAGDMTFDVARSRVERGGGEITLTAKEYALLRVLMAAGGGVVSAEELLERAWDENIDPFTATVRVTIANLRRKLGDPPVIETVIGAGYRLSPVLP